MLAAATRRPAVADAAAATGTSVGAALLAAPQGFPVMLSHSANRLDPEDWGGYVERWMSAVSQMAHPR
jgi:hypothetical protein